MVSDALAEPQPESWRARNPIAALFLGCACLAAVALVAVLAVAGSKVDWDAVPPLGTVGADQVDEDLRAAIHGVVPLEPDEHVLWFYSTGLVDIATDGNLLTDRRVVSWSGGKGAPQVTAFAWDEVAAVEVVDEGSFLIDALYRVTGEDGSVLELWFAAEEGFHLQALETLEDLAAD